MTCLDMPVPPELTLRYANTPLARWEAEEVAMDYLEVGLEAIGDQFAGDEVELCRILTRAGEERCYASKVFPRDELDTLLNAAWLVLSASTPKSKKTAMERLQEAHDDCRAIADRIGPWLKAPEAAP